jgi:hypothetical protein
MNQERTTMRLDQFDLNLLIAFDVLLRERNVTQAAAHLHITQSSMSAALKRLRVSLNDEILVQHGKKMIPTPRALALAPEIAATIQTCVILSHRPPFLTRRIRHVAFVSRPRTILPPCSSRHCSRCCKKWRHGSSLKCCFRTTVRERRWTMENSIFSLRHSSF